MPLKISRGAWNVQKKDEKEPGLLRSLRGHVFFIMFNGGVVFIVRLFGQLWLCPGSAILPLGINTILCQPTTQPVLNLLITLIKTDPVTILGLTAAASVVIKKGIRYFGKDFRIARMKITDPE